MSRDEIIRMAREAYGDWYPNAVPYELERFAGLVAAAERERLKWDGLHSCGPTCSRPPCVRVRTAVEAEREACAKLFDDVVWSYDYREIAAAIRARGQA